MRSVLSSRFLPAVVVAAVLAVVYGLVAAGHPAGAAAGQAAGRGRSVPVTAVQRGCPGLGMAGGTSGRIAMVAASGSGNGRAVATSLAASGGGTPLLTASQPAHLALGFVSPGGRAPVIPARSGGQPVATVRLAGGVVVNASGAMAQGLDVEQTDGASVPTATCTSPGTDFWFTGPGQRGAGRIQLYLMNPADQAADVSVEIATDAGPVQGSADAGIAVPPHSMVMQSLAPALPGSRAVLLHVRTSVGQVVAGVRDSTGGGGGWLPPAQAPASRLIVPGLPATPGTRTLFLAVPGQRDAHVTIAAVTSRGSYQPTGGGGIDVPGGSAIEVSLPSMAGIPAALKLTASVPVTASVMLPGGAAGSPGVFTAASAPLREQGVVAANLAGGSGSSALILSAPRQPATVRITELGGNGGRDKTVQVAAGRTKVVQLAAPAGVRHGAPFPVQVTPQPGSGPVYAGRVVQAAGNGAVAALTPVGSALTAVPLPAVRAEPITSQP